MAFVYEKIREEDKEWVDFSQFKGIWNNPLGLYRSWAVDRENRMALVGIDSSGRLGEEDYIVEAYGFFLQRGVY